jgi:Kdo2-lipid IVA lauroyltransferase/acyltransferase
MGAQLSKRLKWRAEAAGHLALAAVLRQLPVESVFVFGEFLGKMIWPLMKGRQKTIVRNLRIALNGTCTADEIEKLAKDSFIRNVANLLCSSVSAKAEGKDLRELMEVENAEVLIEAHAKGKGVVLLLAHMGNWELLTRLKNFLPELGNLGAFYRPLNNIILNERVLRERQADGTRLFSKRDSLHHVSGFLRDNGIVGILADQRVGRQGELVEFFGRLTRASPLPSLLARRCRSEVVALSLRTVAPGKWSVRCHRVEKPYDSGNCMAALEEAMKVSVVDVFWLQERWKVYLGKVTSPAKWLGDSDAGGAKPHRALIWAKDSEKDLPLPPSCLHGDISYEKAVGKEPCDLEVIDAGAALPIDYILVFSKNTGLRTRAMELGIPMFLVSQFSE